MTEDLEEFNFEFECLKTEIQTIEIDSDMFNHFLNEKTAKSEINQFISRLEQRTNFSYLRYDSSCMNIKMKLDNIEFINSFPLDFDTLYNKKLLDYKKNNSNRLSIDCSNVLNQFNLVRILNYEAVSLSFVSEEKLYKGFADGFDMSRFSLSIQSHLLIDGTVYYGFTPYYDESPFETNLKKIIPKEFFYIVNIEGISKLLKFK